MRKLLSVLVLWVASMATADAQTPYPDPITTGDGALILSIWDPVLGASLVYAIPTETYQSLQQNRPDLDGFSISVPDFASTFIESNSDDLRYTLFSAGGSREPDAEGPAFYVTRNVPVFFRTVTNVEAAATYDAAIEFNNTLNAVCATDPTCVAFSATDPQFAGQADWGTLSSTLPFDASGGLNEALFFFQITQLERGEFARGRDVRGESGRDLVWMLDDTGTLTASTVVPLPASLLLFLSGALALRGANGGGRLRKDR